MVDGPFFRLSDNAEVLIASISLLNTICIVGNEPANLDIAMNPYLLTACKKLLISSNNELQRRSAQFLMNLATVPSCIQCILADGDLMLAIVQPNAKLSDFEDEQIGIIINIIINAEFQQRKQILKYEYIFSIFAQLLHPETVNSTSNELIIAALKALEILFKFGKENNMWDEATALFKHLNGLDYLEQLQLHPNIDIYQGALLAEYVHYVSTSGGECARAPGIY